MTDEDAAVAVEVARTADLCALAAGADEPGQLAELLQTTPHPEELVAMWARLLVTLVPEDRTAELVDQLWREDDSEWLIAVEHFLDYAHRRQPGTLARFTAEVTAWPAASQAAFAGLVLAAIADALPEGMVPSHYLVARGLVVEAAASVGAPELADALAGLVALGWREPGALPAARLAYDLARHVEQELPGLLPRRQAVAALALVVGGFRDPGEPVVVRLHDGSGVVTDADEPLGIVDQSRRATVVAARVVRHAGRGEMRRLEAELTAHAPAPHDLLPVLLALALAAAAYVREDVRT
ncbi:hypothetical protein [Amycolatopsis sacchari]|uniref:Uncharacterized protein n=1 Tax=Amycolatopsis sacchari TaxID=115433 RepID=A0A1I3JSX9_9PSEU|nr:hypothetical protein [Amycolatopsis sacchari]SFI63357.1 hypothetical protein SAMN05421835_101263 [Amycolatopsis sacchari]